MTESGMGNNFPKEVISDGGTLNSRGMNTGLGSQSKPDHADTPRSYCQQKKVTGEYGDWTDHVFEFGEDVGYSSTDDHGTDPSSNKSFDGFLWRESYKWCAPPYDSTNICEDIVCNDKTDRQEKPNQSFEN